MEQLKLLSMTAVITLIVWASADRLVNDIATVRLTIEPMPSTEVDTIVEPDMEETPDRYELQISGPRKTLKSLRDREPLNLRLPISETSIGPVSVALSQDGLKRAIINQWPELHGLAVLSVKPRTLPVIVDRMVSAEFDVSMANLTLAYDDEPQLQRTSTTARLRESLLASMVSGGQRPEIDISREVERIVQTKPAGESSMFPVTLDLTRFGPGASLDPASIDVTATLKTQRSTAEISTVPIKPVVSFANLGKSFEAVGRDGTPLTLVTQTVRITGPTDEVMKLVRGETRAYGLIQFKEADLRQANVIKAWTPEFHLPAGIELAESPRQIEFRLVERPSSPAE